MAESVACTSQVDGNNSHGQPICPEQDKAFLLDSEDMFEDIYIGQAELLFELFAGMSLIYLSNPYDVNVRPNMEM